MCVFKTIQQQLHSLFYSPRAPLRKYHLMHGASFNSPDSLVAVGSPHFLPAGALAQRCDDKCAAEGAATLSVSHRPPRAAVTTTHADGIGGGDALMGSEGREARNEEAKKLSQQQVAEGRGRGAEGEGTGEGIPLSLSLFSLLSCAFFAVTQSLSASHQRKSTALGLRSARTALLLQRMRVKADKLKNDATWIAFQRRLACRYF